jgi:hypothetical protein
MLKKHSLHTAAPVFGRFNAAFAVWQFSQILGAILFGLFYPSIRLFIAVLDNFSILRGYLSRNFVDGTREHDKQFTRREPL